MTMYSRCLNKRCGQITRKLFLYTTSLIRTTTNSQSGMKYTTALSSYLSLLNINRISSPINQINRTHDIHQHYHLYHIPITHLATRATNLCNTCKHMLVLTIKFSLHVDHCWSVQLFLVLRVNKRRTFKKRIHTQI